MTITDTPTPEEARLVAELVEANPVVAELLKLDAAAPVRLTFSYTGLRRAAGSDTLEPVGDRQTVEAFLEGLGNLFGSGPIHEPLAVRYRHPWQRYDSGRLAAELVAVELLDYLTGTCSTCSNAFPITGKIRPRECPSCAAATAAAGAAALAEYPVGAAVDVHAMGHWYAGEVVKVGKTNVTVRYTSGAGVTRDKSVNPAAGLVRVRP